ncbi:hypothetical protein BpHYR1_052682 [Brachionus plicatilis]|uniref:Uncharacterized protein n=1 Tax=Brachionus plicatilis TaxID=10195 RepID=A0A3M7Q5B6_BRAPC|nr:hypothetical protein BpHYR1_052682 [Brachionus plicatilis]
MNQVSKEPEKKNKREPLIFSEIQKYEAEHLNLIQILNFGVIEFVINKISSPPTTPETHIQENNSQQYNKYKTNLYAFCCSTLLRLFLKEKWGKEKLRKSRYI